MLIQHVYATNPSRSRHGHDRQLFYQVQYLTVTGFTNVWN